MSYLNLKKFTQTTSVLIFGASGQDGYYLGALFVEMGARVIKFSRSNGDILGDVQDYDLVSRTIKSLKPTYIINFAANSTIKHDYIFENHQTITTGCLNILEATKKYSNHSKVFITGSGLQFKNIGNPISEHDNFEANSAYSLARIHTTFAARYYRSLGMRVYVGFLFHHESSHRHKQHISKAIVLAAQRIAVGSTEILKIGDIKTKKEWAFSGDIMRGIITLIEQDDIFEATIGSGAVYSIEDWLELCFKFVKKDWRNHVECIPDFKSEYSQLVSNPETINSLGWKINVGISELAEKMMSNSL